ncbi:MAG: hypothetical protein ABSG68_00945 [Thermoguttaceae bacterium]|jgi:CheY-like chemotaxis protein
MKNTLLAVLLSVMVLLGTAWAQEEEPKAAKKAAKARPAAAAKARPTPAREKDRPEPNAADAKVALPPPEDPAVAAILETKPKTPAELFRAAKVLADLEHPEVAKMLLKKILDARLTDQQFAALADEFGSGTCTEMATRSELLPEAQQLADAVLKAVNRTLQDPQRIAELLKQLQDPAAETRTRALAGLREAGAAAVDALIAVLVDPQRAAEHDLVRTALVQMGSAAAGPLETLLEAADPELVLQAVLVLAKLDAPQVRIFLLRPALAAKSDAKIQAAARAGLMRLGGRFPGAHEALAQLVSQAQSYFQLRQPMREDAEGRVEWWTWDGTEKHCKAAGYAPDHASRAMAARLARDAYEIVPDDPRMLPLYLATQLEEAADTRGRDQPLDPKDAVAREVARFGARTVEDLLEYSLAGQHPAAAAGAARILAHLGTATELLRQGATPSPLVAAAASPDRRVRMAALETIVALQPDFPFAGSSHVPDSLLFLANSSGRRRALVAGPSTEAAREVAGMLSPLGYQVDTATTGGQAIRLLTGSPDYELALIDPSIADPGAAQLVQDLRRDNRTAKLRIGLLARSGFFEQAERIARGDPLTLDFARPHTEHAFDWQMEQLTALAPRDFLRYDERQQQAAQALTCLATLAVSSGKIYDIHRAQEAALATLFVPRLNQRAIALLMTLGTSESQRALVDLASRFSQPLEIRKAAARAFRISTEKHGILLTVDDIRRQYRRYDRSGRQDMASQAVLSAILDSIEAPSEQARAKQ